MFGNGWFVGQVATWMICDRNQHPGTGWGLAFTATFPDWSAF